MAYFDPIVEEKLRQFASEQGISVNKAIAFILKRYLQEEILRDQVELIKPVIENVIAREMKEACEILEALEGTRLPISQPDGMKACLAAAMPMANAWTHCIPSQIALGPG